MILLYYYMTVRVKGQWRNIPLKGQRYVTYVLISTIVYILKVSISIKYMICKLISSYVFFIPK